MKLQILFGVVFAFLLVEIDCIWDDDDEQCAKEFNLNKADLKVYIGTGKILPEDNTDFNNFWGCTAKRARVIDDNGDISWDVIENHFEKEFKNESEDTQSPDTSIRRKIVLVALDNCRAKDLEGTTDGQTAVKLRNCLIQEIMNGVKDVQDN